MSFIQKPMLTLTFEEPGAGSQSYMPVASSSAQPSLAVPRSELLFHELEVEPVWGQINEKMLQSTG